MNIYTLNVGQGQFAVVTGNSEAFIVDTYVPLAPQHEVINVKGALSKILDGKNLVGLMLTGFDDDHFNQIGLQIVLNKYRPSWIMYPKYFKKTENADSCFEIIEKFERDNNCNFVRVSVKLDQNDTRWYENLSKEFSFEVFSPHGADMDSSNNCSLVVKAKEKATGKSYLITGDTENNRWDSIVKYFSGSLRSDILAAPHHGSKNGITDSAAKMISPHTVIISAGVNNQYAHPDKEALVIFRKYSNNVYNTNYNKGQSIETIATSQDINSYKFC